MKDVKQFFVRVVLFAVLCVVVDVIAIFSFDRVDPNAEKSQFYGDKSTYPTQPFNTWTNLAFCATAAVALANIKWDKLSLYVPFLAVAVWAEFVGVGSSLFHASTSIGKTGLLDIGGIPPLMVSVLWLVRVL